MSEIEKAVRVFLKKRGWHTYYNPNYWVNKKTIQDSSRQDYTNYGMPIEMAFVFEVENFSAFRSIGSAALSKYLYEFPSVAEEYFGKKSKEGNGAE